MTKTYKSELSAAIHETAEMLHENRIIDKTTMREFDESCLAPVVPISADEIRSIRERARLSQSVFARYLNISKNLVSDWERGVKKPGGPALRLLTIVKNKGVACILS